METNQILLAILNSLTVIVLVILTGRLQYGLLKWIHTNIIIRNFGEKFGNLLANRITFIGVIFHELSHWLFAILTGAKVTEINLFSTKNGKQLGHVNFVPRGNKLLKAIQLTLASLAPLITGIPAMYWLINSYIGTKQIELKCLIVYLIISLWYHMKLSEQDIKIASKGIPLFSLLLAVLFYIT